MFRKFEIFLALRYIRGRKDARFLSMSSIFSLLGIIIGVATLIVVMSVMNGFKEELINKIIGANSHVNIYGEYLDIKDYDSLLDTASSFGQALPIIESTGVMSSNRNSFGGRITGLHFDDFAKKDLIDSNIISPRSSFTKENFENNGVIIGYQMAKNLGVEIGDIITILSPKFNITFLGAIPKLKKYEILGIFNSGMYEYDSYDAFISLGNAQGMFGYDNRITQIELYLEDVNNTDLVAYDLQMLLPGYNVSTWRDESQGFISALEVQSAVLFIILSLIILIAAFNIISGLVILVNSKKLDIAILRSLGCTKYNILRIFFLCGAVIGIFGTLVGVGLGVLVATNIDEIRQFIEAITGQNLFNPVVFYLSNLPSKLLIEDVVLSAIVSILFSFIATIFPALRASAENPSLTLRQES